jgi:Tfp pilus assembly protein PilX
MTNVNQQYTARKERQRGAVAIYTTFLMVFMITSSALLLSSVLSRQIRLSADIVASERAFYAANSGVEEALFHLVTLTSMEDAAGTIPNGEISYREVSATYNTTYNLIHPLDDAGQEDTSRVMPCIASNGRYQAQERSIVLGREDMC